MPIGLSDLFGAGEWVPAGMVKNTKNTKNDFYNLVHNIAHPGRINGGGTCSNILQLIPVGTANTFEFESRSQRGFKFIWLDIDGVRWQVHGHEPDAGALSGHVGAMAWSVRIQSGKDYLMSEEWVSDFPPGHRNYIASTYWKRATNDWIRRKSHVVLINP